MSEATFNAPLTVVLVHGAFADSSNWDGVIERRSVRQTYGAQDVSGGWRRRVGDRPLPYGDSVPGRRRPPLRNDNRRAIFRPASPAGLSSFRDRL